MGHSLIYAPDGGMPLMLAPARSCCGIEHVLGPIPSTGGGSCIPQAPQSPCPAPVPPLWGAGDPPGHPLAAPGMALGLLFSLSPPKGTHPWVIYGPHGAPSIARLLPSVRRRRGALGRKWGWSCCAPTPRGGHGWMSHGHHHGHPASRLRPHWGFFEINC